jgi:hypothetical protein
VRVVAGGADRRGTHPRGLPGRHDLLRPAGLEQQLGLAGAGVPAEQGSGSGELGPGEQHLAGVRVRRAWLGVQVVPVVPERDQPEVGDRREHRRPRAHHHRHPPAAGGEERAVPLGRPERRGERDVPSGPEHGGERGVEAVEVAGVGDNGDGALAGPHGGGRSLGEPGRPVLAGQRRPDGASGASLAEGGEEAGRAVHAPAALVDPDLRDVRLVGRGCLLGARVAGRDGEAEDIGEVAGVPVGDRPGQACHLGGEHHLG